MRRQNARVLRDADLARVDDTAGGGHGADDDAVGRGYAAGDGDAAGDRDPGELDEGAGTRPDAGPVPRPTMGGRLVRRQNARRSFARIHKRIPSRATRST